MTASAPTRPSEASAPSTALTLPAQTSQPHAPPLVRYETMCRAIAECHRIDEVKDLRDKARALEVYAQQARNTEAEDKAREIRNRAQRRMGELLRELPRMPREERAERTNAALGRRSSSDVTSVSDQEGRMLHDQTCVPELSERSFGDQTNVSALSERSGNDGRSSSPSPYAAALEANGLSRYDAHRAQKLAAIPEKDFEEALRNPVGKPTTAKLLREAFEPPKPRMNDETALWLWGRAVEFERRGIFKRTPGDLLCAMLPVHQNDMRRLIPLLADFYNTFKEVLR